jgi:hypothetical protein
MIAKYDDFLPDCWVVRQGIVDSPILMQYIQSFHWSFQTLATVGFGDIPAKTNYERVFALMAMIIGIGFYSYTIGNMTSIIASLDTSNEQLQQKIAVLKEL